MTYRVKNEKNNIELVYNNVAYTLCGCGVFMLVFDDESTATFHYRDDDGSEWDYTRLG